MHVSDFEMRDDELLKAGRSSSIGSGSGSGKQGLGGVAQGQLQLPGGSSQGPENGLGSVGSATSCNFWPLTFTPGLPPGCAGGGYRKINWLLITIFQFNKFTGER